MAPPDTLAIKGDNGSRISISDCKLQPLNLLIPGGAPVMVPKHKAWPGAKKKEAIKAREPLTTTNSYDAGEEDDPDEERVIPRTKSRRASKSKSSSKTDIKARPEKKLEESCKKTTKLDKLATEAKQRKKLERQVKEQEEYIAKLKAKYAAKKHKHATNSQIEKAEPDEDTDDGATSDSVVGNVSAASSASTSGGAVSDASDQVRHLIKSLKIKGAGTDNPDFNPSEDSQLLARKENGESWGVIAKFMGRPKKQLQKRHKELLELGKTAETAGTSGPEESTEAAATTADTDKDAPTDALGGLFDLGRLQARLEATAAEQAQADKSKGADSDENDAVKAPKTSPVAMRETETGGKKKDKKKPKQASPAAAGGESGYESGSEDVYTKVFIGSYAKRLLTDKSAIPAADDNFDEDDCILMALADARRKGDRWKQMQADFANLTGRMVPVEVLKYKLGEGDKPESY
ncbi:hypothetical protein KVR01_010978 [Diaporthe batatas]|uniref:uncharacterized protein n=1 Tax=Diaporthe batatas TaxID=748121 RepID=UPI001D0527E9|nr:uncharacterized protein KVR01_010978 [Diaporthe batatas]KAG8159317.1 hypothetical protein KVR01_010978 [Diaporthe batatas]